MGEKISVLGVGSIHESTESKRRPPAPRDVGAPSPKKFPQTSAPNLKGVDEHTASLITDEGGGYLYKLPLTRQPVFKALRRKAAVSG